MNTDNKENKEDTEHKEDEKNKEHKEEEQNKEHKKDEKNKEHKEENITKFWIYDPYILLNKNKIFDLLPVETMTREEKLNAISKFVIYTTILGVFLFRSGTLLLTGIFTLVILVITYFILNNRENKKLKEAFSDRNLYEKFKDNYTNPDIKNPIMNVLLPEIQQNPDRLPAAPSYNNVVQEEINNSTKEFIKKNFNEQSVEDKLFNDLGDKFQFEQSMRQFYSTANTRVPNNQKDFAQFCYGNMASCKDGDVDQCLKNNYRHTIM
tara:strand:+ start:3520 stop:4314 length:795 start_codon:yes stop_codon:yes gene_type:complete